MLSPASAKANSAKQDQRDSDEDGIQKLDDWDAVSTCTVDSVSSSGIDSIERRLRQSNIYVLSRYKKVCVRVREFSFLLSRALRQ